MYRGKNATWGNAIILVCSARPLGKPKREYEEALKKLVQQNMKAFFSSTIPDKYCDIFQFQFLTNMIMEINLKKFALAQTDV